MNSESVTISNKWFDLKNNFQPMLLSNFESINYFIDNIVEISNSNTNYECKEESKLWMRDNSYIRVSRQSLKNMITQIGMMYYSSPESVAI